MTKEKDPNENVLNPRLLVFPQDSTGYLYKMKNEVLKAIERQNGNQEKHDALMGTLRVLAGFAKRRMAMQADARAAAVAAVAEAGDVLAEPETPAGDEPTQPTAPSEPTQATDASAPTEPTEPTTPSEPSNA